MKQVLGGHWGCVTRTVGSHETGVGWSLGLSQGQRTVMKEVLAGHWGCVTRTEGSHETGSHKDSAQS